MFQTGYKGIQAFSTRLPYDGGFCHWYYTPKENIVSFPAIDPATQYLTDEPTLIDGATWYGAIKVPNDQLGFEEQMQSGKSGIFYKQKVSGFHVGDSGTSRVNLENMPYHEYVVVGKLRAGGLYLIVGDNVSGLEFSSTFKTSGKQAAGSEFVFANESLSKALILPSFAGDNVEPPPDYVPDTSGGVSGSDTNLYEIIWFNTETEKVIDWTPTRLAMFGIFPEIQVWSTAGAKPVVITCPIDVDAAPPSQTNFTVYTPGTPGFIILK